MVLFTLSVSVCVLLLWLIFVVQQLLRDRETVENSEA